MQLVNYYLNQAFQNQVRTIGLFSVHLPFPDTFRPGHTALHCRREDNSVSVKVRNYHDDHKAAPPANVHLEFSGIPAERVLVHHYRIDEYHSNAFTLWREMGAPQQLTDSQLPTLKKAGQPELLTSPRWIDAGGGSAELNFELPTHGVSFLQLSWM